MCNAPPLSLKGYLCTAKHTLVLLCTLRGHGGGREICISTSAGGHFANWGVITVQQPPGVWSPIFLLVPGLKLYPRPLLKVGEKNFKSQSFSIFNSRVFNFSGWMRTSKGSSKLDFCGPFVFFACFLSFCMSECNSFLPLSDWHPSVCLFFPCLSVCQQWGNWKWGRERITDGIYI